jgi:hypothetical protein
MAAAKMAWRQRNNGGGIGVMAKKRIMKYERWWRQRRMAMKIMKMAKIISAAGSVNISIMAKWRQWHGNNAAAAWRQQQKKKIISKIMAMVISK